MGSVPTSFDWAGNAGNFASATDLQAGVGDVLDFLLDPPGAQVRRTTAQAISAGVPVVIAFDAEDSDNDTMHSTSSNTSRLTCATAGRYLVSGAIPYDAASSGTRGVRLLKNSGFVNGGRVITTSAASITVVTPTVEVSLAVGDFLELQADCSTAVNTTAVNGLFPIFRARWIGP